MRIITPTEITDAELITTNVVNEAAPWEPAATNLLSYPRQFDNAYWNKFNDAQVFPDTFLAPDGTLTAERITGSSSGLGFVVKINSAQSGMVKSIYLRTVSGTGKIGALTISNNQVFDITEDWQRFDYPAGDSEAEENFYIADFRSPATLTEVIAWHAQLEEGTVPTSIIPDGTTFTSRASTAKFIDDTGTLQTAAIDVARDNAYGYVDGVLKPIGLLLEGSATNLFLNSNTLATQSVTVAAKKHTLHFTGTGTVTLSGAFSGSLAGTGTGESNRVSLSFTSTSGTVTATVSGTVTNAMVEENHYATSYTPSGGTQVTRAADVSASPQVTRAQDNCVRMLGDEFNQDDFTLIFDFNPLEIGNTTNRYMRLSNNTGGNRITLGWNGSDRFVLYYGVDSAYANVGFVLPSGNIKVGNNYKVAIKRVGKVVSACVNGGVIGSNTAAKNYNVAINHLELGREATNYGMLTTNNFTMYPNALSDTQMQLLTGGT